MKPLDKLLHDKIAAILAKEEPSVAELELARKFLNDFSHRGLDASIFEEDPSLTAQALYGSIQFDELPLTQARYQAKTAVVVEETQEPVASDAEDS
jgi:hypothetical protein